MKIFYQAANVFFFVFHIGLIFFNLFGWLVPQVRKWNLVTLGLTAFSWFAVGAYYGWGYCFLTDWHWAVREQLGYDTQSNSYIHFLITVMLPVQVSEELINTMTVVLFFAACIASIVVNFSAWRNHKNKN